MKEIIPASEIKRLREKTGLSQKEFANMVDMTLTSWQRKETATSSSNRKAKQSEYILLQLLANEHPIYELKKR